jgi:hypothetical protein
MNISRCCEGGVPRKGMKGLYPFPLSCPMPLFHLADPICIPYNKLVIERQLFFLSSVSYSSKLSHLRRESWELLGYSQFARSTGGLGLSIHISQDGSKLMIVDLTIFQLYNGSADIFSRNNGAKAVHILQKPCLEFGTLILS